MELLRRSFLAFFQTLPLRNTSGLTPSNAELTPTVFLSKPCLKMTAPKAEAGQALALVDNTEFTNGVIEVEVAGEPAPGASGGARGFVGLAFRVQPDRKTYDCFYVRPTNGRAEDQERRNHTVQYISHPVYTWSKLRAESPSRYESYVDVGPAEWISLRIEVKGEKARLFVNGARQPVLIVNDLKTGRDSKGGVALWMEASTVAHFANLKVHLGT